MKNNLKIFILLLLINIFLSLKVNSGEVFNFDVTEAEIINDGKVSFPAPYHQ